LVDFWRVRAPGTEECSTRSQLLCLRYFLNDEKLAEQVSYAWAGLSRACHQHPYELPPTAVELLGWIQTVEEVAASIAEVRRSSTAPEGENN
jgi:hypothetical protein